MKNNDFDSLFEDLNFDIEEPHTGHKERFFKKLDKEIESPKTNSKVRSLWAPLLGIAASLPNCFHSFRWITGSYGYCKKF